MKYNFFQNKCCSIIFFIVFVISLDVSAQTPYNKPAPYRNVQDYRDAHPQPKYTPDKPKRNTTTSKTYTTSEPITGTTSDSISKARHQATLDEQSRVRKYEEAERAKYSTYDGHTELSLTEMLEKTKLENKIAESARFFAMMNVDIAAAKIKKDSVNVIKGNYEYYIGAVKDGKKEGYGMFIKYYENFDKNFNWNDGHSFTTLFRGIWKNDMREGDGTEVDLKDSSYKRSQTFHNDHLIKGCVMGNCLSGYGIYRYENGSEFEGIFKDGATKTGDFAYNRDSSYMGEYNGQRNGFGTLSISYYDKVQGDWKNNILVTGCRSGNCENGTGVFTYPSGITWEGNFKRGKPEDEGEFRWAQNRRSKDQPWQLGTETKKGKVKIKNNGKCTFICNDKTYIFIADDLYSKSSKVFGQKISDAEVGASMSGY